MSSQQAPLLSPLAVKILEERYLLRNEYGEITETPAKLYGRVAETMGNQEKTVAERKKWTDSFLAGLLNLEWSPSSPCLMNAGTPLEQLSACFILEIQDTMEDIFTTLKDAALIYKTGGGVGFYFGKLREKGALISTTQGQSGGTLAWLQVYDKAIQAIAQGGKRRGAALGVLPIEHPDIRDWLQAKSKDQEITNFNLSIAISAEFMKALELGQKINLISPLGSSTKQVEAQQLWEELAYQAWATGEPGLFFCDRANQDNPNPHLGRILSGNPCNEFLAIPRSSCNLASINLEKHLKRSPDGWHFDWTKFSATIVTVVRFLDNMITANQLPLSYLTEMSQATRPIGLGFMGLARVLKALKLPYNSPEGRSWAEQMVQHLRQTAEAASCELAQERGTYPAWPGSTWQQKGILIRNSNLLSIAPTGTIATLVNTSWSLEPEFAPLYQRRILGGKVFWEIDPQLVEVMARLNLDTPELRQKLESAGSIQQLTQFPPEIRRTFVYALDLLPEDHLLMQAAIQRHVDGAISKTINLPADSTVADVEKSFRLAHQLGLKGCTVYRQGTRLDQVLSLTSTTESAACSIAGCTTC